MLMCGAIMWCVYVCVSPTMRALGLLCLGALLACACEPSSCLTVHRMPVPIQLMDVTDLSSPLCQLVRPAWLSAPVEIRVDSPVHEHSWATLVVKFDVIRKAYSRSSPAPVDLELTAWKEGRRWPQARTTASGVNIKHSDRYVEVGMHVWKDDIQPGAPPVILHIAELNTECPTLNATAAVIAQSK